ncbi:MAG: F0F1 ATP synthase subunit A [Elusimicrobia bacterium]|nr:F0F1 ATP synthase subunit A [Elusimicrobiota bacterium]
MNFESILAHHLVDHKTSSHVVAVVGGLPVDMGLSPLIRTMWIACAVAIAALTFAARSQSSLARVMRSMFEPLALFVRDQILEPIFGHHAGHYLPYFLTLFFFLLTCNLLGLVPHMKGVTANPWVTAGMAICTFGLIQYAGVKEQGLASYVVHIVPGGVPLILWPLLFVIEVFGMFAKCISLCIRLFANMLAGHVVSLAFLCMIFIFSEMSKAAGAGMILPSIGLALFIYTMDVLVSFLQAYIFTFLTALFVGGAVHPH